MPFRAENTLETQKLAAFHYLPHVLAIPNDVIAK
jgi:hypothetical protein